MFSFLSFLPILCVGRSFANPLSNNQHFSFSSLRVRSTDDDGKVSPNTCLLPPRNSISFRLNFAEQHFLCKGASLWTTSGLPPGSYFRWNDEATTAAAAAQIFSTINTDTDSDSDLLPAVLFGDPEISGTPEDYYSKQQKGCRAPPQVRRGKVRIRDDSTSNNHQAIAAVREKEEQRQLCSPADAPSGSAANTNGGIKPFNLIKSPPGSEATTGMDHQSQNTQEPQKKEQQIKDQRTDEEKQVELRAKNAALPDEDQMKCRHNPHRIRLDCDGPLGEERVSAMFGLDYKEIWNCYPGT